MPFPTNNYVSQSVSYDIALNVQNGLQISTLDIVINFPTNEGSPLSQALTDAIANRIATVCNQQVANVVSTTITRTYTGSKIDTLPFP